MTKQINHRLDDAEISTAAAVSIAGIALGRGLVLKKVGGELIGPCPHCGGTDRFAINIAKQVFNCRGCTAKGKGAISFVMFLHDVGFRDAVEMLIGKINTSAVKSKNILNIPTKCSAEHDRHQQFALELWQGAGPAEDTPVAIYLARRGLHLPSQDVIRFHPRCPFGQDANGSTIYTSAMIALVRGIVSNDPQAIHRTALDREPAAARSPSTAKIAWRSARSAVAPSSSHPTRT